MDTLYNGCKVKNGGSHDDSHNCEWSFTETIIFLYVLVTDLTGSFNSAFTVT